MSSLSSIPGTALSNVLPKGVFSNVANCLSLKDLGSLSVTERAFNVKVREFLQIIGEDSTNRSAFIRDVYQRVVRAVGKEVASEASFPDLFQIYEQIERDTVIFVNSLHSRCRGEKEFSSASEACEWLNNPENTEQLQRVKVMDLHGKSIQYLPPEISQLSCLKSLHIYDNQLRTLPSEMGSLTQLEFLFANNNPLEALPRELSQLPLSKIDLRSTKFEKYPVVLQMLGRCEIVKDASFPVARGPLMDALAHFFGK